MRKVIQPSENLIYERQKSVDEEIEKAKNANKKDLIGQLSITGREVSARNLERRRSIYQVWKEKQEKSAKTKIGNPWRGNQSR